MPAERVVGDGRDFTVEQELERKMLATERYPPISRNVNLACHGLCNRPLNPTHGYLLVGRILPRQTLGCAICSPSFLPPATSSPPPAHRQLTTRSDLAERGKALSKVAWRLHRPPTDTAVLPVPLSGIAGR